MFWYSGFVERARAVERLLRDRRTTFVVVSTLEAAPVREADYFIQVLSAKRYHLGALVLNRVLPGYLLDEAAGRRAEQLSARADDLGAPDSLLAGLVGSGPDGHLARVLAEVGENFRNFAVVARREAKQRQELAGRSDVVAVARELDTDINDMGGLLRLGEQIWNS